jgi:NCS1 family nucleobase:cation symporter-1
VDISWIIGLVVPSVLYYLFARRDARPATHEPAQKPA